MCGEGRGRAAHGEAVALGDRGVEGDAEEIERFRRDLNLCEKGMVRVKGILEQ